MRGLSGSWLVVGDGTSAPVREGALVLDERERVLAVGELSSLRRDFPSVRFEAHAAVLMPGLVNAHAHLELSALHGRIAGGRGFVPWVDALVQARVHVTPELEAESIDAAVSELLSLGVVALGDVTNRLSALPALTSVPLVACVFHEVFGLRKETAEVMLGMAKQARSESPAWPRHLRYALSPHTPYTLHPEVLQDILSEVRSRGARTSMHLAEHSAERAFLTTGLGALADWYASRGASVLDWRPPGCDAITYAKRLGALGSDVIAVHLCDARPDEISLVAQAASPVVLCPRSNLHIELKLPPLLDILRAGIRPGLGSDSLASSPSLDPLAEARSLAQRFPSVAARTLLAMATSYGAEVLGFGRLLGRLHAGLYPGVLAFEHGATLPADPERFLLTNDKARRLVLSRPAYHRLPPEDLP
jgi:cytosine/adenosine deaminase-related metal-dependent hydrolase